MSNHSSNKSLDEALHKIGYKATIGLAAAVFELSLNRLAGSELAEAKIEDMRNRGEALWAAAINPAFSEDLDYDLNFDEPTEGQVDGAFWVALSTLMELSLRYNEATYYIHEPVTNLILLARHIVTNKIVKYRSGNLITPLVNDMLQTGLSGTACVLTKTNEEAMQITGLLLKEGMQARLIQTNDTFNLYNIAEIRFFLNQLNQDDGVFTISDDSWNNAKRKLSNSFRNSNKMPICINIIKDFEATNPKKKYKSDLDVFIRESKLEDFFSENGETIFVSTIHKAKGKEFDNVFLLLDNFNATTDEAKRQLYVAITRAKQNLTIHLNAHFLDHLSAENLEHIEDNNVYSQPNEIAMHLKLTDVWLGYFINKQTFISQLISGDHLTVNGTECFNSKGQSVLKFSKGFCKQIEEMKAKNYTLKTVKVNFIVYWLKEGAEQEIKIILPEVYFERNNIQ